MLGVDMNIVDRLLKKQAELETKLYHAELAAKAEANEVDKRGKRIAKLEAALDKAAIMVQEAGHGFCGSNVEIVFNSVANSIKDIAKEALED